MFTATSITSPYIWLRDILSISSIFPRAISRLIHTRCEKNMLITNRTVTTIFHPSSLLLESFGSVFPCIIKNSCSRVHIISPRSPKKADTAHQNLYWSSLSLTYLFSPKLGMRYWAMSLLTFAIVSLTPLTISRVTVLNLSLRFRRGEDSTVDRLLLSDFLFINSKPNTVYIKAQILRKISCKLI